MTMKKIYISSKSFNSLKQDKAGAKTQRVWTHEFKGLGVSLGMTTKSIIYKYKSPIDNKLKIITLDSFNYDQILNDDLIDEIVGEHYSIKSKIRAGICPITEKEQARAIRVQAEAQKQAEIDAQKQQAKVNAFTLDDAHKVYCNHRSYTHDIKQTTRDGYDKYYLNTISPILGKKPVAELDPRKDINVFLDSIVSNAAHNTAVVLLRRIQDVCYNSGLIDNYFILKVKTRDIGERDRTITDLPAFMKWLKTPVMRTYKNALYAQLLHGTRATEFNNQLITIPWIRRKGAKAGRISTQKPLLIPLTKPMVKILDEQRGYSDKYVFPLMTKDKPCDNSIIYSLLIGRYLRKLTLNFI